MQIKIEINTDNVAFKDNGRFDKAGAINRIMKNINETILDYITDEVGSVHVPIKDINGKELGVLEINF